jgi:uncharacterized lipoprotein YddW (UPF0748 family)
MMSMRFLRILALSFGGVAVLSSPACAGRRAVARAPGEAPPRAEFRAFWVDEFHAGIRTEDEATRLVSEARRANINTLFVQVRGHADALYAQSFEPPYDDTSYDPDFDALEHIIEAAHRAGLEVYAWLNATPAWRGSAPPRDPHHVFNLHGPGQTGDADWLTRSPEGGTRFPLGYFLDPGHPAAAAYLAEIYLNIVRHYAVDGIHFDFMRYPETRKPLKQGAPVGYNAVSLDRFRRSTGREDTPEPDDPQWTAWRRQQVTQLVRRIYIEAKAINPRLRVSAAVIAWDKPPISEKDFDDTRAMQWLFQDWHGWLKEGILDLAVPMNYVRENGHATQGWFDGWVRWEKRHKHGRALTVGIGAYMNPPAGTLAQIRRVRDSDGVYHADGVSLFSYAALAARGTRVRAPDAQAETEANPGEEDPAERVSFLTTGAPPELPAFSQPAAPPEMEWIERATRGWLAGTVRDADGGAADGAVVTAKRGRWFARKTRTLTDGNGYFGFAQLRPGRYHVRLEIQPKHSHEIQLKIVAGRVAQVELIRP